MELPVKETLTHGEVSLQLLNTLCPTKAPEYATRSTPWINNPQINQYLGTQGTTIKDSTAWYRKMPIRIDTDRSFAIWVDGKHVGNCGIHTIDVADGHGCLGIVIGESTNHSKGIGTSTIKALCEHAFKDLDLRKVYLDVVGNNPRGIRCYEKCGFVEVGRKKAHIKRGGKYYDYISMELFAD